MPTGGYKIDNQARAYRRQTTKYFKVDVGVGFAAKTRGAVKHADNFEVSPDWCSAKAKVASKAASRPGLPPHSKKNAPRRVLNAFARSLS